MMKQGTNAQHILSPKDTLFPADRCRQGTFILIPKLCAYPVAMGCMCEMTYAHPPACLQIAADEARHFGLVQQRLRELGSHYGAIPAHKTLWDHAINTRSDLLGRIAVVPLVQEARGLDAGITTPHHQGFALAEAYDQCIRSFPSK
jgi:hypothetical protein